MQVVCILYGGPGRAEFAIFSSGGRLMQIDFRNNVRARPERIGGLVVGGLAQCRLERNVRPHSDNAGRGKRLCD